MKTTSLFQRVKYLLYRMYNRLWRYKDPVQYWNTKGNDYDTDRHVTELFEDDRKIIELLNSTSCDSLLEVGCATGRLLTILAEASRAGQLRITHFKGIDFSDSMVVRAREKLKAFPNLTVEQGSALSLQFEQSSFDVVLTRGVLMHLRSQEEVKVAVCEAMRVASKFCIFVEEVAPKGQEHRVNYSPNGLATWWDYRAIFESQGMIAQVEQRYVHKETVCLWMFKS